MFEHFQSDVPSFRTRLSETIAWCSAQPLESNPVETAEIWERRRMGGKSSRIIAARPRITKFLEIAPAVAR
jgi:hypothetical protein